MKRQLLFGTMLSAAMVVGVAAQSGTGSATQGQTKPQSQEKQETVTVSGCLLPADEAARMGRTGTSGTATGTAIGTKPSQTARTGAAGETDFVLMTSEMGAKGRTGVGTSGTAGTRGSTAAQAHKGYRLSGGEDDNLRQYANKRVEIRGTIQGDASMGARTRTGTGAGSATGQAGSATAQASIDIKTLPMLSVTSVRELADSCSADKR